MAHRITERARSLRNNPTDAEKLLWEKLRHDQMGFRFRRQHPIGNYYLDFYAPDLHLAIEVDGGQHADNLKDQQRTQYLNSEGIKVLRYWNNDILSNIDGVIEDIQTKISLSQPSPSQVRERADNFSSYRKDFPILRNTDVAYLDSASSAQKPQVVINTYKDLYENHYANIHRGLYGFSQETTLAYEAVRSKVAAFINAPSSDNIIFTRNTTEAINLVAQSWGRTTLKAGDEIIVSAMDHHANIVPWQLLKSQIGVVLKVIPMLDDGTLDLEAYQSLLSDRTRMVSIVHASNALGTINPVAEIIKMAKAYNPNIVTLVDGSQSVVHSLVDVQHIGCDFLAFTGHKVYGPNGVGVLYGRSDILDSMPPYQGGGDMIETVSFDNGTTFKPAPARFEAGTPAIAEVIALGVAIDYMLSVGMEAIAAHEAHLLEIMMRELQTIDGLTFYGTAPNKVGVVSFTAEWAHTSDIAMILDQCHVAVRTGHHCCMPLMQRFGIDGTVRASLGLYSNEGDIDALIKGLHKAKELLG